MRNQWVAERAFNPADSATDPAARASDGRGGSEISLLVGKQEALYSAPLKSPRTRIAVRAGVLSVVL